jgi:zinc protease
MKKFNTIFLLLFSILIATAQEYKLDDKIPVDKDVRIGKLDNGFTYYIRKNNKPEQRVELRLAVNAGSVLEEDDQQGLAHFVEHMAFNGTKHFAKNELISTLQSLGVRFGANLNAYTSFDETVYQLSIPTNNQELLTNAFQILEDWAHNLSFDPQQIDGERGIITEEWRTGRGADQRMRDQYLPEIFYNSKYANRLPIGKIDIVQNFKHERLIQFYKDWYRPDLMALVVVGDIDVDKYEQIIKKQFGSIAMPQNPKERKFYPVPDHADTRYVIVSDKESTQSQFIIYSKKEHSTQLTLGDYRDGLVESLYLSLLNERFNEIARGSNPPFVSARASATGVGRTKDAFAVSGRVRENGGVEKAMQTALEELERVRRYGFTASELDRAKKEMLRSYERAYENKDKTESGHLVGELVRNYLDKEAIPGITFEYNFPQKQLPTITLKEVNAYDNTLKTDSNKVVVVLGTEKKNDPLPDIAALKSAVANAANASLQPYEDRAVAFVWKGDDKLKTGKIVGEKHNKAFGYTTFTLSNGVKVAVKPTDFKNNEITVTAYSQGGHSLYSDEDYYSAIYASMLVNESGIGGLSKTELNKALAGKSVSASIVLNANAEGIKGRATVDELETCLQLFNFYFTQPTIDSTVFNTFMAKQRANLSTIMLNPGRYFDKQIQTIMSGDHPRKGGIPSLDDLSKMKRDVAERIVKERFANAADFSFVIVGTVDTQKLKPLLEKYIASLPSTQKREQTRDLGIRTPKGNIAKDFFRGKEDKSSVNLIFSGETKYKPTDSYHLSSLNEVLSIRFLETLREEKSGVYGVRATGSVVKHPYANYKEQISFQCASNNVDSLIQAALEIVEKIKKEGVDAATLEKIKKAQKNSIELSVKSNSYWEGELLNQAVYNIKPESFEDALARINKLSSKDLQNAAKKYFNSNYARFVLYAEKN